MRPLSQWRIDCLFNNLQELLTETGGSLIKELCDFCSVLHVFKSLPSVLQCFPVCPLVSKFYGAISGKLIFENLLLELLLLLPPPSCCPWGSVLGQALFIMPAEEQGH